MEVDWVDVAGFFVQNFLKYILMQSLVEDKEGHFLTFKK